MIARRLRVWFIATTLQLNPPLFLQSMKLEIKRKVEPRTKNQPETFGTSMYELKMGNVVREARRKTPDPTNSKNACHNFHLRFLAKTVLNSMISYNKIHKRRY